MNMSLVLISLVFIAWDFIFQSATSDRTFVAFFIFYVAFTKLLKGTAVTSFMLAFVMLSEVIISYFFNGPIVMTERFAVWYVLLFLFGVIQRQLS